MLIDKMPDTAAMVPSFLREIQEFSAIYQAEDLLLSDYWNALKRVYADAFPATATRIGLTRRLQFLNLPVPEDEEECRSLLLNKLSAKPPFRLSLLENICQNVLKQTVRIRYFAAQRLLEIRYIPPVSGLESLSRQLRSLVPAAVQLVIRKNDLVWNDLNTASLTWLQLNTLELIFQSLPFADI